MSRSEILPIVLALASVRKARLAAILPVVEVQDPTVVLPATVFPVPKLVKEPVRVAMVIAPADTRVAVGIRARTAVPVDTRVAAVAAIRVEHLVPADTRAVAVVVIRVAHLVPADTRAVAVVAIKVAHLVPADTRAAHLVPAAIRGAHLVPVDTRVAHLVPAAIKVAQAVPVAIKVAQAVPVAIRVDLGADPAVPAAVVPAQLLFLLIRAEQVSPKKASAARNPYILARTRKKISRKDCSSRKRRRRTRLMPFRKKSKSWKPSLFPNLREK